jgi:hypothetical protein
MSQFTYHPAWGQLSSEDQQDLVDFWVREKALPNAQAAQQRVAQVVMFARDEEGEVAGVCTAMPQNPPQLGQPVYFYRSFIALRYRQTLVVFRMLKKAIALLEDDARKHDWPCIGVLLELENDRFGEKGRMPVWPGIDFVYVGKSPRGLECRIHWFRDARLKS